MNTVAWTLLAPVGATVLAFVATNIDDLALLLLLFAAAKPHHRSHIFWGQSLGLFAIGILSVLAVQGLSLFSPQWLKLLGLVPLAIGIKEGVAYWRQRKSPSPQQVTPLTDQGSQLKAQGALISQGALEDQGALEGQGQRHWWQVAAVVLANSGDNLAVNIPLLTPFSTTMRLVAVVLFTGLALLWCAIGLYMSKHPLSRRWIGPHSEAITAIVLIVLGLAVLLDLFSL